MISCSFGWWKYSYSCLFSIPSLSWSLYRHFFLSNKTYFSRFDLSHLMCMSVWQKCHWLVKKESRKILVQLTIDCLKTITKVIAAINQSKGLHNHKPMRTQSKKKQTVSDWFWGWRKFFRTIYRAKLSKIKAIPDHLRHAIENFSKTEAHGRSGIGDACFVSLGHRQFCLNNDVMKHSVTVQFLLLTVFIRL